VPCLWPFQLKREAVHRFSALSYEADATATSPKSSNIRKFGSFWIVGYDFENRSYYECKNQVIVKKGGAKHHQANTKVSRRQISAHPTSIPFRLSVDSDISEEVIPFMPFSANFITFSNLLRSNLMPGVNNDLRDTPGSLSMVCKFDTVICSTIPARILVYGVKTASPKA